MERRTYARKFKLQAVRTITDQGLSVSFEDPEAYLAEARTLARLKYRSRFL
ncbi:MAG: hypothetical protein U0791_06335 [Gemmataceae bacterium]